MGVNPYKLLFDVSETRGLRAQTAFVLLVLLLAGTVSAFLCVSLWLIQTNWQIAIFVLALTFRKGYRLVR